MERAELTLFREALRRPFGEVLITGPTGAGKSTTLYAGLEELNRPEIGRSTRSRTLSRG